MMLNQMNARGARVLVAVAVIALALLAVLLLPQAAQAATVRNIDLAVGSSQGTSVTTCDAVDITGDGKSDVLEVRMEDSDGWYYKNVYFYVNGKLAFSDKRGTYCFPDCKMKLMVTKSGRAFLFNSLNYESAEIAYRVLTWKGGKLKVALDCMKQVAPMGTHHNRVASIKASGNKIVADHMVVSNGIGQFGMQLTYKYKGGKLVKASEQADWMSTSTWKPGAQTLHTAKAIQLYKAKGCKSKLAKVPAGATVKVSKVYVGSKVCSLKVKYKGKTGWYKIPKKMPNPQVSPFKELYYAG